MDIDALASEFGSAGTPSPASNGVDINSLAAEFGSKPKAANETAKDVVKKVIIRTPAPPISDSEPPDYRVHSGIGSDNVNKTGPTNKDTEELIEGIKNYGPSIGKAIGNNASEGWDNFSTGLGDIVNKGEAGSGAKKMGLGALQAVTAIPAGLATEGAGKPAANITGSKDIGDRAAFVAGSAIPIVPGLSTISKLRPSNVALKDLTDMITNNGANPENLVTVVQGMKANPRLGPADLNPAVLSATQKLFTTEGDTAKNYLKSTSDRRVATSKDAVAAAYNDTAGIPVSAIQKLKDLAEASKTVGREQINPAVAGAKPVDLSPVLEHIDSQLKPGVNSVISKDSTLPFTAIKNQLADVRKWLANKTETRTGAADLHNIQSAMRKEAENLLASSDGANRALGNSLMGVRNKIVDAINEASPKGTYKEALSNYKDEKHIGEAFHNAFNGVFSNSKKLENLPEFTEQWVKGLSEHELEAAKEGARLAIYREMGQAKNGALAGTNLVKSDFNKQRLESLFGKKEAGELLQKLEHERLIANTHNKIIENSQTAMRTAAESKIDLTPPKHPHDALHRLSTLAAYTAPEIANYYGTGYAIPGIGLATSLAATAGSRGLTAFKNKVTRMLELERNASLAKMALPTEGPSRDALIKSLEAAIPGPKQSLITRSAKLSRLVAP